MSFIRKHAAYARGTLAVVSGIISVIAWWLPSSAAWLNHSGLIAWPLTSLMLTLFVWAILNWNQSAHDLAAVRASLREPVQEDRRLFNDFKQALPKGSPTLIWLREGADDRLYHLSNTAPLRAFVSNWRSSDVHFVNADFEQLAQTFVECAMDFLSYHARNSEMAPHELQSNDDDPLYYVYNYSDNNQRRDAEVHRGLCERADKVLAAHDDLYTAGSRLGL